MGTICNFGLGLMAAGVITAATLSAADAKPARCFTTDDGYYDCDFRGLDATGSFRIQAPGYPAYTLEVYRRGFAYGSVTLGGRNVALPGQYVRSREDGACWNNPETGTKLCAW